MLLLPPISWLKDDAHEPFDQQAWCSCREGLIAAGGDGQSVARLWRRVEHAVGAAPSADSPINRRSGPGITINTSPNDYAPLKQMQMMRFVEEHWELFGPVLNGQNRCLIVAMVTEVNSYDLPSLSCEQMFRSNSSGGGWLQLRPAR
jgi:hypothetical protein